MGGTWDERRRIRIHKTHQDKLYGGKTFLKVGIRKKGTSFTILVLETAKKRSSSPTSYKLVIFFRLRIPKNSLSQSKQKFTSDQHIKKSTKVVKSMPMCY